MAEKLPVSKGRTEQRAASSRFLCSFCQHGLESHVNRDLLLIMDDLLLMDDVNGESTSPSSLTWTQRPDTELLPKSASLAGGSALSALCMSYL